MSGSSCLHVGVLHDASAAEGHCWLHRDKVAGKLRIVAGAQMCRWLCCMRHLLKATAGYACDRFGGKAAFNGSKLKLAQCAGLKSRMRCLKGACYVGHFWLKPLQSWHSS
jgi:hypothetical protein